MCFESLNYLPNSRFTLLLNYLLRENKLHYGLY
ncbi:rCG59427, partial [Rattus norvegicus]